MCRKSPLSRLFGITNTHSVGVVHDAVIEWIVKADKLSEWTLPVVAETWDGQGVSYGGLNDANGFHVKKEHAFAALEDARGGPVAEGSVGGGTGMMCNEFKGGIGTSSRALQIQGVPYTLGVLVQCNYGLRSWLSIAGVPVGMEMPGPRVCYELPAIPAGREEPPCDEVGPGRTEEKGSIIVVIATDAPLLPHQLKRVARRVVLGLGRVGSSAGNGSGDIFIAFSTANPDAGNDSGIVGLQMIDDPEPLPDLEYEVTQTTMSAARVGADDHVRRHPQKVDHRRHHDEAAAYSHDRRQHAHHRADQQGRDRRDVEVRGEPAPS